MINFNDNIMFYRTAEEATARATEQGHTSRTHTTHIPKLRFCVTIIEAGKYCAQSGSVPFAGSALAHCEILMSAMVIHVLSTTSWARRGPIPMYVVGIVTATKIRAPRSRTARPERTKGRPSVQMRRFMRLGFLAGRLSSLEEWCSVSYERCCVVLRGEKCEAQFQAKPKKTTTEYLGHCGRCEHEQANGGARAGGLWFSNQLQAQFCAKRRKKKQTRNKRRTPLLSSTSLLPSNACEPSATFFESCLVSAMTLSVSKISTADDIVSVVGYECVMVVLNVKGCESARYVSAAST